MSTFNCKMCGGALEIQPNATVVTCDYCGTQQTLPKLTDEKRANLYDRASHFRRNNEFDKAMAIYEQILNEDQTDAEAYWSLVLCQYGIEYVEDPLSHRRIPTVNRAQFTSIFDDDNYKSALKYADMHQRILYEEEAKAINEIQKGILAISSQEEPFDVFICYKETDNNGRRTPDSVLANDLYYQLTNEGFKVFFSRITLEDKLGTAYEPYIFAALNSAKVMVVLGTKEEYFNAVWVKNEWSRYLALVKKSNGKKMLIPAYRDMDPYNLPEEFSHLQAQDMSKLGFMQDLVRGIKKITNVQAPQPTVAARQSTGSLDISSENSATRPLIKRMMMFLEDGEWSNADEYCERILDIDPECSMAYIGKLMAKARIKTLKNLNKADFSLPEISKLFNKACKFSNPDEYDLYQEQHNIYEERKREEQKRVEEQRRTTEERNLTKSTTYYIGTVPVALSNIKRVEFFMEFDKKLDAIKYVREITNWGLVEAKTWVENYKSYDLTQPQVISSRPQHPTSTSHNTVPTTRLSSTMLSHETQLEIKRLEKKHRNQIIWGCVCLIYWPIAVVLFICAASTKKKINALKEGKCKVIK